MESCLVIELKGGANNPNLPILETMQQFTLDAIALSGNGVMSEEQKFALNHFFYQVGAIGNGPIWQKVKHLFMPMICNDNAEKAFTDYVLGIVNAAAGNPTFVNHGIHYDNGAQPSPATQTIYTNKFTGDSLNLTVFQATMKSSFITSGFQFMFDSGSSADRRIFNGIGKAQGIAMDYTANAPGVSIFVSVSELVYDIGCVTNLSDSMFAVLGSSNNDVANVIKNASAAELSQRSAGQSYVDKYLKINAGVDSDMGLFMICEGMSKEESQIIINAIKGLKQAFSEL